MPLRNPCTESTDCFSTLTISDAEFPNGTNEQLYSSFSLEPGLERRAVEWTGRQRQRTAVGE